MNKITFKMKTILSMGIIIMSLVIIFIDEDILNSLVIQNNNINNLTIEEVAYSITTDENTNQDNAPATDNNLTNLSNTTGQVVVNNQNLVNTYATNLNVASTDYWSWPTESNYTITSYYGSRWGSTHKAIDISGTGYGSNIYAANNGVVTTVRGGCITGNFSCNGRGGNYIIINHNSNNYYTIYMHLKDINVREGDVVSRGQVIGTMGNTGNVVPRPSNSSSTAGTHLHFGLYIGEPYKGGYAVNPMRLY